MSSRLAGVGMTRSRPGLVSIVGGALFALLVLVLGGGSLTLVGIVLAGLVGTVFAVSMYAAMRGYRKPPAN